MRRRAVAAALGLAAVGLAALALALALLDDDGGERPAPSPPAATAPSPVPPQSGPSLAVGLTEMSPALLWSARSGVDVGAFAQWRDRVAALRPRYLRVLVDWAQLQPDPAVPPSFDLP
ncbi:MAG TPA: hypothetical protein VLB47_15035, partial [Solirubrobacteraceae bacterium]|nr:hypothetical protein [Solirubrobacteraceae bacterium]